MRLGGRSVAASTQRLWTNRHELVPLPTHTRAPDTGSVTAEGGGTTTPTLGGGFWFSGEHLPAAREVALPAAGEVAW
jgi:hypothetical protein